jgi:hypothetical protein
LQEINKPKKEKKEKSSSRIRAKKSESNYSKFITVNQTELMPRYTDNKSITNDLFNSFAEPTANHGFKDSVSQFKMNKENLKQKKLTKQASNHSIIRPKSKTKAALNKKVYKNYKNLKISEKSDKSDFNSNASFKLAKTPGS